MKRLALAAAVLFAVAACSKSDNAATDTATPAMAPAPAAAPADTGMKRDTSMKMDTTKMKDTTIKAVKDTTVKAKVPAKKKP